MAIDDMKLRQGLGDILKEDYFGGQLTSGNLSSTLIGVLTIETDAGARGHSFLGRARQGADHLAKPIFQCLKSVVTG